MVIYLNSVFLVFLGSCGLMGNAPEIGDALLTSPQVSLIIFVYILLFVSMPLVVNFDKYPY